MTERDDDLKMMRNAMQDATPVPDAARRAQSIARAGDVFARHHRSKRQGIVRRRPLWPFLGVGTTALVAFLLVVLPPAGIVDNNAPLQTTSTRALSDQSAFARTQATPEALPRNEEAQMAGAAPVADAMPQDVIARLTARLDSGQLPAAGTVTVPDLLQALTPAFAPRMGAAYAVPWSDDVVLRDIGNTTAGPRFALIPQDTSTGSADTIAPDDIRYVIGLAGFATLLENGARDLNGWGFQDALRLVRRSAETDPDPLHREAIKLIQTALAISSGAR